MSDEVVGAVPAEEPEPQPVREFTHDHRALLEQARDKIKGRLGEAIGAVLEEVERLAGIVALQSLEVVLEESEALGEDGLPGNSSAVSEAEEPHADETPTDPNLKPV